MIPQQPLNLITITPGVARPRRGEWIQSQCYDDIVNWTLVDCADFYCLGETTQRELPRAETAGISKMAVRMRMFALLGLPYIPPQYKDATVGKRGSYIVLLRLLMAQTCNLAQQQMNASYKPVLVRAGNGQTMNSDIRKVYQNALNNFSARY